MALAIKATYYQALKKILKDTDSISRFILTHYDSDHIQGAISFIKENGEFSNPSILNIEQVWLNTFRHLQFSKRETKKLDDDRQQKLINFNSNLNSKLSTENEEGDIGAKQASTLGKELIEKNYPWNTDFKNKAICTENLKEIYISDDIKLHLLTPNKERLQNLECEFVLKLSEMGLDPKSDDIFDDAFELFNRANEQEPTAEGNISAVKIIINSKTIKIFSNGNDYIKDDSIGNGSSISFILETENKNVLFLADAFAEDVIEGLKKKYPKETDYPIFFDAIKISHHGSFRNNSPDLFKIIDSDKFLFSTNGKHQSHKHPDVETISCIINRSLPDGIKKRNLIFNYDLEHIKDFNNEELKTEFNYQIETKVETEI